MVNKHQGLGWLICIVCVAIVIVYTFALFWPALEAIRLWLVAIPVFIAFAAVLGIGTWIGWTMATTPPPKPIEEIQIEDIEEKKSEDLPFSSNQAFVFQSLTTMHARLALTPQVYGIH